MLSDKTNIYPRISVRISPTIKIKLQSMALQKKVKPSDLVQFCLECILNNPDCQARKIILKKKGQRCLS